MRLIGEGDGFFDKWSLSHLTIWLALGVPLGAFIANDICTQQQAWMAVAGGAIAWELFETFLDKCTTFSLTNENFLNRWISDPVMAFIGAGVGMSIMGA